MITGKIISERERERGKFEVRYIQVGNYYAITILRSPFQKLQKILIISIDILYCTQYQVIN